MLTQIIQPTTTIITHTSGNTRLGDEMRSKNDESWRITFQNINGVELFKNRYALKFI